MKYLSTHYLALSIWVTISLTLLCLTANATSLRIVTEDLPPLQISRQNYPDGAMIELVNLLLNETKLAGTIEFYPWARSYQIALTEPNTLIFSMLRDASREKSFHWIGELYTIRSYLVALKERDDIKLTSLEDAKKYSIATVRKDLAENYLLSKGFEIDKNLYSAKGYSVLWKMLFNHRTDLAFTNSLIWRYELERTGLQPEAIQFLLHVDDIASSMYLAASKDTDPDIVEKLTQALTQIKIDGRYQQLLDKWQI